MLKKRGPRIRSVAGLKRWMEGWEGRRDAVIYYRGGIGGRIQRKNDAQLHF